MEEQEVVHAGDRFGVICERYGVNPSLSDEVVYPTSAMDPKILRVSCPVCAAAVSRDLAQ